MISAETVPPAYKDVWDFLNQRGIEPLPARGPQDTPPTFQVLFDYFKANSNHRVMNIGNLSKNDRTFLARHKISARHLFANFKKTINPRHFHPRTFQHDMVKKKTATAICPFSGRVVESHHSFFANINVVFYRFKGDTIFYVATGGIGSGFTKCAIYLPGLELIVKSAVFGNSRRPTSSNSKRG